MFYRRTSKSQTASPSDSAIPTKSLDDNRQGELKDSATLKSSQKGQEDTEKGDGVQVSSIHRPSAVCANKWQDAGHKAVCLNPKAGDTASAVEEGASQGTVTQDKEQRAQSYDSAMLWTAVGTPTKHFQALAQFNDHEHAPFEDGEVEEQEDIGPPPNQEALRLEDAEEPYLGGGNLDNYNFVGEHRRSLPIHDMEPTSRKRSFSGSAVSEEALRSARRPRVHRQETSPPLSLPSIREMIRNPWSGMGGEGPRSCNFSAGLPMSTPLQSPFLHKISPFHHDEQANVSGHAPTFRGSSVDTTSSAARRTEVNGETRHRSLSRMTSRSQAQSMEVDEGSDADGRSLLEKPVASQRRDQGDHQPLGKGPRSLYDILQDQESHPERLHKRNHEDLWRGGYRPNVQADDTRTVRGASPDTLDQEEGVPDEPSSRLSHFSALPNTKAWQYRQDKRREGDARNYHAAALKERSEGHIAEDTSYALRAGGRGSSRECFDEEMEDDQDERVKEAELEWWQRKKTARLPTALMEEEDVEDVPKTIDHPHSDRWTVHLSDPEEWYAGMSKEWMKHVWLDEDPTVLFTVFNYKYTNNGEINRHIEGHVTAITTQLTGESDFHVVPPDPEWRRELSYRELPSIWAIRGLSEAAAWEMIRLRVISSRGVSIITHPKSIQNPSYVCGLAGFLRPDVKSTKLAVLSVLESDHMTERLAELVRSNERMEHLPYKKRVEKVIESLDVRFMETKEDGWVANVFITPPTDDPVEWRQWAEEMRSYDYNLFLNGKGRARRAFWCAGCRGVDHEEMACPFPKSRGWKGPMAGDRLHTKFWLPESARGRKPGRGREHGRGSMHRQANQHAIATTPVGRGRGNRGGAAGIGGGGRGAGPQRGGHTQRGGYEQWGGARSEWNMRTPSRRGKWDARY